jgi:hypothetical protein
LNLSSPRGKLTTSVDRNSGWASFINLAEFSACCHQPIIVNSTDDKKNMTIMVDFMNGNVHVIVDVISSS